MLLKNKNILITGAGKGIGEQLVQRAIKNGAFVYAVIKDKRDNRKFKKNKNLKIYNGNVRNINLFKKIFKDSEKEKKKINSLINNAGVRFRKKFLKIKSKEIKDVFETNFFSIFSILQLTSEFWIKRKIQGSVINLASIVGQIGFEDLSVYAATKGAVISLTKSFSVEMAKYGIRANSISPGFTKTSFYEKFKKKKKLYNWTLSRIPMKRWGTTDEISNLILFVISDKSKYLNGENISIDGGWINS
tara:strand:- start:243 stop:980 length:738 start_codon:yes stop_codon:yes gene_type:complete